MRASSRGILQKGFRTDFQNGGLCFLFLLKQLLQPPLPCTAFVSLPSSTMNLPCILRKRKAPLLVRTASCGAGKYQAIS